MNRGDKEFESCGEVIIDNYSNHKNIKQDKGLRKSKMQQYRDEVKLKLSQGKCNWENTNIDISKRDMYSILTESGVDVAHKNTNYSSNFINWHGTDYLFDDLKRGKITIGKFIRLIREHTKHDVGVTTINYKLREKGINKKELGYSEYELYKRLIDKDSWTDELYEEDMANIIGTYLQEDGLNLLLQDYSIGEIASVLPIDLKTLCNQVRDICEQDSKVKKWVEFINIWNPNALEYRVEHVALFNRLLAIADVKDVAKNYKLPLSTVRDYKKRIMG